MVAVEEEIPLSYCADAAVFDFSFFLTSSSSSSHVVHALTPSIHDGHCHRLSNGHSSTVVVVIGAVGYESGVVSSSGVSVLMFCDLVLRSFNSVTQ